MTPFILRPDVSLLVLVWGVLFCTFGTWSVDVKWSCDEVSGTTLAAGSEEPRAWKAGIPYPTPLPV